ncbi:hypothetical protein Vau01_094520 [Virgisporangium aurantiacum]|uniref:PPE family domain-containing protein n=1 Tax=Virgisporangium aurantiacum TaxID=175570 RepID=A0A8J3ZDI2_9ACTN|nr:hypothetical protein Vau01_094520 [Virgisporangium aurantiacum]
MSESHWAGKSVPQMWASAQAADTQTAWQQVNAWRRTHDLLLHHAGRLKACADELAYAWPPGRSPAAQAFVAYITELRTAIENASADAATNYTAIAGVLTSLSSAKADMAQLMQAWDSYENSPTAEKARRSSAGSPDSPDALNAQARARMSKNDQEVLESSRRFVDLAPTRERGTGEQETWNPSSQGGIGSGSASTAQLGASSSTSWVAAQSVSSLDAIDDQVGLAGGSVASKLPGSVGPATSGVASGLSPAPEVGIPNPGLGAVGGGLVARAQSVGEAGRLARPSGLHAGSPGVVGGASPTAPVAIGSGRGQGKVNPIGGVIEPGRPMSSASALPLTGRAGAASESHRESTAALTLQWDVLQGVSPVIEPSPETPFELGPGVIGIDR